jgi:integrase
MPVKAGAKDRWLTRQEAARLLRAARRHPRLARFVLIGLYTGTRKEAILALKWTTSLHTGYVDLQNGLLHRSGAKERATNKRRPPCRIPAKLLPHLIRWRDADMKHGWPDVCHHYGLASRSIKTSWATARNAAGLGPDVTPHTLRHTATTWLMQRGVPVAEVAGFVGLSIEMVDRVYGHHSPDHQSRAAGR